ncbi:conserved membrane [Pyrenophora seminiperda CCB06]|uniref:Conserved membrane n=1 Tax=Pyrenophora seminiperda CCB06 TaxID=1302712 RepID=A0A3M7MIU4_9PLEO|nr:conserved membrane [Pyrenophora seminiperda CCB06]
MATAPALPEQLIYLIIRFTASVPDLPLSIHTPRAISTLSLKQLIRQHLPSEHASARLRLIYAGKVLADTEPVSRSLKLPPPPPPRNTKSSSDGGVGGGGGRSVVNTSEPGTFKNKGKQPLRSSPATLYGTTPEIPTEAKKFYIHCSLGDALSASELASEATLAAATESSLKTHYYTSSPSHRTANNTSSNHANRRDETITAPPAGSSVQPQAQGFDRLLASGFTPQEVASLRSHFTTNLSFTHTPDTMPSPAQIRVLEDRWLDESANDPSASLAAGAGAAQGADAGWGAGFAVEEGGLDDMLYGYLTGFFFPLGSLVWGFREEGVWTRRRQVAVVMGVLINAVFGFMRWGA